ncbi:tyrosine-type recombinase/integrase [Futiania mangrovi]|uniref:Tyrosine-type recombinase/integrase n=1 Tax=Futiania mangrovi TaxID=2959716 RepID=A0A9J6PC26_9PROT|nr:tyrosine-type recombinase/integrase [Futiania mangrovii]MCP1335155.1 tyrosine-type recombinase/integrase [Futiania mangrovii]
MRYRRHGRTHKLTVGPYPAIELAEAREEARAALRDVDRGEDPKLKREAAGIARRTAPETYREAVEDYHTRYQVGQRGNATAGEVLRALLKEGGLRVSKDGHERIVHPKWINRPVADIDARAIRKRLEEIRDGREGEEPRPYMANRAFAYWSRFFAWAAEPGIEKVPLSPMIGLKKPWDGEESRSRVFNDDELKALWQSCDKLPAHRGAFVRLLMLTGKRKRALAGMRWADVDEAGIWTPPTDPRRRARTKRQHPITLPQRTREILASLPRDPENPFVFVGRHKGRPLYPGSDLQEAVQEASGVPDFYFHALRHTVETRLAVLKIPPHVRDAALDHVPARGAGAGYDHHDYREEVAGALEKWSREVGRLIGDEPGKVIDLFAEGGR